MSRWVPRQCGEPQAPSTRRAVPAGRGGWSGRHYTPVARGSLSQFRRRDPPPTQPGPGGAHKAPLFLPWNEWIGGSRDRLSAGDTRDPAGQAEGKGTGGGMEGQTDRAHAEIAGSGETLSCASRGVAALVAPAGGQLTLPAPCQPWGCAGMCRSAPEMLTQPLGHSGRSWLLAGATKPWEQCDRAPAVLAQTSWHCLQGMGSWKSRSYSGSPSLKKPPQGAGRGGCGIRQPRLIPTCGIPALLSCPTPSSLCKGHKPREREASRAHGRCPTLGAQPRAWAKTGPCHRAPI